MTENLIMRFLKENDIFAQYVFYRRQYLKKVSKVTYFFVPLICAFNWGDTDEGRKFWENLRRKEYEYERNYQLLREKSRTFN